MSELQACASSSRQEMGLDWRYGEWRGGRSAMDAWRDRMLSCNAAPISQVA